MTAMATTENDSFPGAPGLPIFYVPTLVWVGVTQVWKLLRVRTDEDWRIGKWCAGVLIVVCIAFVWSSLASPTHRECSQWTGEDCDFYESRPGPDSGSALLWLAAAAGLFAVTVIADQGKGDPAKQGLVS